MRTHRLMAYSTALTSWLVVASNFFTSSAWVGPKSAISVSKNWLAAALSGGTSLTAPMLDSVCAAQRASGSEAT